MNKPCALEYKSVDWLLNYAKENDKIDGLLTAVFNNQHGFECAPTLVKVVEDEGRTYLTIDPDSEDPILMETDLSIIQHVMTDRYVAILARMVPNDFLFVITVSDEWKSEEDKNEALDELMIRQMLEQLQINTIKKMDILIAEGLALSNGWHVF